MDQESAKLYNTPQLGVIGYGRVDEKPKTFQELSENDKIWQLQNYLSTLAQIQSLGVEMKMEINAVTRSLNEIMGLNVIQPVRK